MAFSRCLRGTKRQAFIAIILFTACLIIFIHFPTRSNTNTELCAYTLIPRNTDTTDEESSSKITEAPPIDNMYLQPPSQQWIREQFDKAYRLLGYKKPELRSWMKCNFLIQQFYFKNINTVFTALPKSGNSNWKEALLLADGGLTEPLGANNVNNVHGGLSDKIRLTWWKKTTWWKKIWWKKTRGNWIDTATREAFSFTVVRNPWTRMVSGYKDKIAECEEPGTFKATQLTRNIRIKIVEEIRGVHDETLYPTFEEFLLYLIKPGVKRNVHFIPQYEMLCLKEAGYDYVIPLEYSNVMQKDVWNHINTSTSLMESYDGVSDPRQQSSALRAKDWFSKIKPEIIEKLYDLYRVDFVLMNYSNFSDPNFPLPLHNTEL